MAGMQRAAGKLAPVARFVLILLITACFLCFYFATFMPASRIWLSKRFPWGPAGRKKDDIPVFQISYTAAVSRFEKEGAEIPRELGIAARNAMFIMQYGSLIVAVVATFWLRSLPAHKLSAAQKPSILRKLWLQFKRVVFYQLPPRRFLLHWCGGLHAFDIFVTLIPAGIGVFWVHQYYLGRLQTINTAIAKGTFEKAYKGMSESMAKYEALAERSGFLVNAALMFLFFPVPRSSFLQHLFNSDFSSLLKYHRWWGHWTMIATTIHGVLYYVLWGIQSNFRSKFVWWQQHGFSNLAGNLSYIFGLILWVSSFDYIRRRYFEVFYRLHIVGFLGYIIFAWLHYGIGMSVFSAAGLLLYCLDLTFRLAQWMNVSIVTGSILSESVLALHLRFSPHTRLEPNSLVFISCPDASRSEWHPFTISLVKNSTSPEVPATATIFLKPYGQWVRAVVKRITDKGSALVKVDGPYLGRSTLIQGNVQAAVIFAGGIGVTPTLGLLAALRDRRHAAEFRAQGLDAPHVPQKVVFIWACRNPDEFHMLDSMILSEARHKDSWLEVRLHCTGPDSEPPAIKGPGGPVQGVPLGIEGQGVALSNEARVSLESTVKENGQAFPPLDRPELKLASPFFLKPSLLQGYGIGYPLWAFVHLLCLLAYFFTLQVIEGYNCVQLTFSKDNQYVYWTYFFLQMAAFFVGAMGLPALVIFPLFFWRRRNVRKATAAGNALRPLSDNSVNTKDLTNSAMEAGTKPAYVRGRPDVRPVLKEMQLEFSHLQNIHVYVAGPDSMVRDVKYNCIDLNTFTHSPAQLICEVESFTL